MTPDLPFPSLTRRASLQRLGALAGAWALSDHAAHARPSGSPTPPTEGEKAAMARYAAAFMGQFQVPGLSVAIACQGRLVYEAGFGVADTATQEKVTPQHLFRIASMTKPITSAAIYTLVEQGKLRLADRVFGRSGILAERYGNIAGPHLGEVTVHHLLTHTGGGWENDDADPMFFQLQLNHEALIDWVLRTHPLKHAPGEHYAYSNFGYCVLGRVIEQITGESYPAYVQRAIFAPCGIAGPHAPRLAGNTLAERAPGEVIYYAQEPMSPYSMNVRRMDSHGGWLATTGDLVRFATHVDGFTTTPNLLRPETIQQMTKGTSANSGYASGWCVNQAHNLWHNGTLPGVNGILVRTASGLCWAALINTRSTAVGGALDQLIWKMAKAVPSWAAGS